jgi:hypothetical protein
MLEHDTKSLVNIAKSIINNSDDDFDFKKSNQLWAAFATYYAKKHNVDLPPTLDSILNLIEEESSEAFENYIKYSIRCIIVYTMETLYKAINRFYKEGMDNLDDKSIFVVADKMISQVKTLAELYNKLKNTMEEKDDKGSFVIKSIK